MGTRMKGIKAIGHVAIRVKDVEPSLDFYVNRLGFPEMFRLDRDGKLWIVYLKITDSQFLEIFPDSAGDTAPSRDVVGYNHMCIEVEDLEAVVAELEAAGVEIVQALKTGDDGNRQAWIRDPDGHYIELMQMMPGCNQYEAISRLKGQPA